MKKYRSYLSLMVLIGLLAACGPEAITDSSAVKSKKVSWSAGLPADYVVTRSLPVAGDHKLRCILEVWSLDSGDVPESLKIRLEQSDFAGDIINFEFEIPEGKYQCLFWADFIAADDAGSQVDVNGTSFMRYTDKYYQTNGVSGLQSVSIIDAAYTLNTEGRDAFFGSASLTKGATAQTMDPITLERPFAKLIVSEKDPANFALPKTMSVGYQVPSTFDVLTGEPKPDLYTVHYTGSLAGNATASDYTIFYDYIFASASKENLNELSLTFTGDVLLYERVIPAGIPLQRNYRTNAGGHLITQQPVGVNITVSVDAGWTDSFEEDLGPKAGDFYYKNNTYSSVYKNDPGNPCIGIVFKSGIADDDQIEDYKDVKIANISGYVVALHDASPSGVKWGEVKGNIFTSLGLETLDFRGYANTKKILSAANSSDAKYPACSAAVDYTPLAPDHTTGWFLPSYNQSLAIYVNDDNFAFINNKIVEAGGEEMVSRYYWTSNEYSSDQAIRIVYSGDFHKSSDSKIGPYSVRSILVF